MIKIQCETIAELWEIVGPRGDKITQVHDMAGYKPIMTMANELDEPNAESMRDETIVSRIILLAQKFETKPATDYVVLRVGDGLQIAPQEYGKEYGDALVGGFHTLAEDVVNVPSSHPYHGKRAGEIMPNSIWHIGHRPADWKNGGYVFEPKECIWVMIYPASFDDSGKLVSRYDAKVANKFSYQDYLGGKVLNSDQFLPDDRMFTHFALGSNNGTSKHDNWDDFDYKTHEFKDTKGQSMISNIGCWGCCGFIWHMLDTGDAPWGWLLAGGHWADGSNCGGRARNAYHSLSNAATYVGGRAASFAV